MVPGSFVVPRREQTTMVVATTVTCVLVNPTALNVSSMGTFCMIRPIWTLPMSAGMVTPASSVDIPSCHKQTLQEKALGSSDAETLHLLD